MQQHKLQEENIIRDKQKDVIWTGRWQGKTGGRDRIAVEANQQLVH